MACLDATGNLNTAKLQRELAAAIGEDDRRRRVDDMKKRAIHTAGTYDEFRHMVSCATLTPVSRKELEGLGDAKKGWNTRTRAKSARATTAQNNKFPTTAAAAAAARGKANANLLSSSHKDSSKGSSKSSSKSGSFKTRKEGAAARVTPMDFERDWRRPLADSDTDRLAYLRLIGPQALKKTFKDEMDAVLLGQVLALLARAFRASQNEKSLHEHEAKALRGEALRGEALQEEELGKEALQNGNDAVAVAPACLATLPLPPPAAKEDSNSAQAASSGETETILPPPLPPTSHRSVNGEHEKKGDDKAEGVELQPPLQNSENGEQEKEDEEENDEQGEIGFQITARECVAWLQALAATGRFSLNLRFLSAEEKIATAEILDGLSEFFGADSEEAELQVAGDMNGCGEGSLAPAVGGLRAAYGLQNN